MRRTAIVTCLLVLSAACASLQAVVQKMDPQTSATITYSTVPLVLYRDDPAHAAFARNFLSLGPLLVNRSGNYDYFVWLGMWNTNHSVSIAEGRAGFDSIVLFVDGEPLALDIAGWTPDSVGASEPVYPLPVASAISAYYRVTADQIRLLAEADTISLRTTGTFSLAFEQWDRQTAARQALAEFLIATD